MCIHSCISIYLSLYIHTMCVCVCVCVCVIQEQLAEERGMLMLPKPGKQQSGKQVYSFGKVSIYLDNRIVYALSGGDWKPIPLEELLSKGAK